MSLWKASLRPVSGCFCPLRGLSAGAAVQCRVARCGSYPNAFRPARHPGLRSSNLGAGTAHCLWDASWVTASSAAASFSVSSESFQSPQDLCRSRERATTRDLPREFTGRGHACAERSDRRLPRKTRRRPRKTRRPVSSSVVGVTVSTRREGSVLCSSGWLVNVRLLCERLWLPWDQPPADVPSFRKTAWISLGKFPDVKSQEEKF